MDVEPSTRGGLGQLSPDQPDGTAPAGDEGAGQQDSGIRGWLAVGRHRVLIGWVVFAAAFICCSTVVGVPFSEDTVLIWLAAALFVASLGDLRRWRRGVLRDWLPLYAIILLYDLLRGYASHVLWGPFIAPQAAFDKFIGMGQAPTVRLQRWLFNAHHLHAWDYATVAVYMSHFFVSFIVAAVLWKRNYPRFKRFIVLYVGLTFVGYVGYVLYPALPPWLAADDGYLPGLQRIVPIVWDKVGVHQAAALFVKGTAFSNDIAAMPSLHAAYPLLLLLVFWATARSAVRVLLVGYVLAMAFSLVYLGEHFVIDELVGWACAIAVFVVGSRLADRWQERKLRRVGPEVPVPVR
jgi:membrane-associated phospholipid phosphatase